MHSHLITLERLNYISRDHGSNRSIKLTGLGEKPSGIPILGTVAAGEPILAVEDAIGYVPFEADKNGEYLALVIRGDSMKNAGILNGDTVIVRKQPSAENGDIIIALLEGGATCKRLSLRNGRILLMPENDDYEPIDGTDLVILGKVTAVIRVY